MYLFTNSLISYFFTSEEENQKSQLKVTNSSDAWDILISLGIHALICQMYCKNMGKA